MVRVRDLRLQIYDKRVTKVLEKKLKNTGIDYHKSENVISGYSYYLIELDNLELNRSINELANIYILYFAMMDVFDSFKIRTTIQKQMAEDVTNVMGRIDAYVLK